MQAHLDAYRCGVPDLRPGSCAVWRPLTMDSEQYKELERRNAMLLQDAIHRLCGCYEVALRWSVLSVKSNVIVKILTSESTLCSFLVRDMKRAVIA